LVFSRRTGAFRHPDAAGPHFTYTVESAVGNDPMRPPPAPADFQTGRIREAADELMLARGFAPDRAKRSQRSVATAIRDHLRSAFSYTTEMVAPPEGTDPIEFFLF